MAASRVEAATAYKLVGDNGYISTCDFTIAKGGRTHQQHAAIAAISFPVCDPRYGEVKRNTQLGNRYGFDGLALHASLLRLTIDEEEHEFEAPLPDEWRAFDMEAL